MSVFTKILEYWGIGVESKPPPSSDDYTSVRNWQDQNLRARSHCTGRCKGIQNVKTILQSVEKRYASVVYSMRIHVHIFLTLYPSNIRTLWFHPRKKFWSTQNLFNWWTFRCLRCQSATYTSNKRSISVIICWTSAVSLLLPLGFL